MEITSGVYKPRDPRTTALYEVVRDNLEPLYGAIGDGAIAVRIPKHARKELEAYLGCGRLCRGFARLRCEECGESRLVAFSCKGRGFCPSCMGRRMNATAADLIERVLPPASGLRQWVLTFPFSWRRRLAQDAGLLGRLTRIVVETVLTFYADDPDLRWVEEGKVVADSIADFRREFARLATGLRIETEYTGMVIAPWVSTIWPRSAPSRNSMTM